MENLAKEYLQSVLITGSNIKSLEYARLGIWEELGEVAGKVKRFRRGDYKKEDFKSQIKKELGDLTWYLTLYNHINGTPTRTFREPHNKRVMESLDNLYMLQGYLLTAENPKFRGLTIEAMTNSVTDLAWSFGFTMEDITKANIEKTKDRLSRGKIRGQGDGR